MSVHRAGEEDRDEVVAHVRRLGRSPSDEWLLKPVADANELWVRLVTWRVDLLLAGGIVLLDDQTAVGVRLHPLSLGGQADVRRRLRPAGRSIGGRLYPELPDPVIARVHQISRAVELLLPPFPVLNLHFSGPADQTMEHWTELRAIAAAENRVLWMVVCPKERGFASSLGFVHDRTLAANRKRPLMEAWRRPAD